MKQKLASFFVILFYSDIVFLKGTSARKLVFAMIQPSRCKVWFSILKIIGVLYFSWILKLQHLWPHHRYNCIFEGTFFIVSFESYLALKGKLSAGLQIRAGQRSITCQSSAFDRPYVSCNDHSDQWVSKKSFLSLFPRNSFEQSWTSFLGM